MTRTFLATVTAAFGAFTLFASAAQACISCEYVPEVVREHQTHNTASASYHRSHGASAALLRNRAAQARIAQARIAKRRAAARIQAASIAKAQAKSRRSVQTVAVSQPTSAKIDASEARVAALPVTDTKTETSAISTSSITPAATSESKVETTAKSETAPKEETPAKQAKANTQVGCKKFLPAVGVTLSVACK